MQLDDRGGKVLDFLKKKQAGVEPKESLDDLPAAPAPSENFDSSKLDVSKDPVLPPIPGEEENITKTPSTPSEPTSPFGDTKKSEPVSESPLSDEPIKAEPLTPAEPEPIVDKPITPEVKEPEAFTSGTKPVSPKDIDPRDRFDDLITGNDEKTETKASESLPVKEMGEEHEDLKLPSADELAEKLKDHLEKNPVEEAPNLLAGLPAKEESPLQHLVEEEATEEPKLEDFPEEEPAKELPEKLDESESKKPKTPEDLPMFDDVSKAKGMGTAKGTTYVLPQINMVPKQKEELAIYISVNDYALVTQEMRKLMRFFSHAGKFLDQGDNPQKVQVINELYKELDVAQQNLMKIDHKLFEGES